MLKYRFAYAVASLAILGALVIPSAFSKEPTTASTQSVREISESIRARQVLSERLRDEIVDFYGEEGLARLKSAETKEDFIAILRGFARSETAQILIRPSNDPVVPLAGRDAFGLSIDPTDISCLNCIGVHCP